MAVNFCKTHNSNNNYYYITTYIYFTLFPHELVKSLAGWVALRKAVEKNINKEKEGNKVRRDIPLRRSAAGSLCLSQLLNATFFPVCSIMLGVLPLLPHT